MTADRTHCEYVTDYMIVEQHVSKKRAGIERRSGWAAPEPAAEGACVPDAEEPGITATGTDEPVTDDGPA